MEDKILNFYKKTSPYTDLGLYKEFAKNLPEDIKTLSLLQRMQIIHPVAFDDENIRHFTDCFWGDMTQVPVTRLVYEDDIFPTAVSMINELLRKNSNYTTQRAAKDKIHTTCRSQAILLAATLKAKGFSARARSGFAKYIKNNDVSFDHWITEYYDISKKKWILVDADMCGDELDFDVYDIPRNKFIFGAESWLGIRNRQIRPEEIYYAGYPYEERTNYYMQAALRALFYDFHCLMNDEIIFLHVPRYIVEKQYVLAEAEMKELDELATLMLNPDENFEKLLLEWENNIKYRIMAGGLQ